MLDQYLARFGHSWPTTTRHLRLLTDAGLLIQERRGPHLPAAAGPDAARLPESPPTSREEVDHPAARHDRIACRQPNAGLAQW
jgi:DNA-binding transcriptional ArsR family regulator